MNRSTQSFSWQPNPTGSTPPKKWATLAIRLPKEENRWIVSCHAQELPSTAPRKRHPVCEPRFPKKAVFISVGIHRQDYE